MARWIKTPGPGQFRGEGQWHEVNEHDKDMVEGYQECKKTGYLPTAEQYEKPDT